MIAEPLTLPAATIPHISGIVRYTTYDTPQLDPTIADSWNAEGMHWKVWDWSYVNTYLQKDVNGGSQNHRYRRR